MKGMPWALGVALALLLPGCVGDRDGEEDPAPPSPVRVDPPRDGGGPAPCASADASQLTLGFTAESIPDADGLAPGLHRVGARNWTWVWASHEETQRQDRVSRVSDVHVFRERDDTLVICTRVDLVAPLDVDGRARTYDVAVRYTAHQSVPDVPVLFVVNWMAGCGDCGGARAGNDTLLSR